MFPQHPHLERANHLVLFTLLRKDNVKRQGKLCHRLCGSWVEQQNQTQGGEFLSSYVCPYGTGSF